MNKLFDDGFNAALCFAALAALLVQIAGYVWSAP
jgi:hypothetical protein